MSQTVRVKMPPRKVRGIMTLKTPYMSPSCAGTIRPKMLRLCQIVFLPLIEITYEAALMMGTRYPASSVDMPSAIAWVMMKLNGRKPPR